MLLRDYQVAVCDAVRHALSHHRSVMLQMPTGTGKTVVLASLLSGLSHEEGPVLVVAHRRELVEQISATVRRLLPAAGVPVTVKSVQWLCRNLHSASLHPSLVVIDEAHHAPASTYRMLWDAWPDARFLGLTATPCRLDGRGFTELFDRLVCSLTVPEFLLKGVLSPFDYLCIGADSVAQGWVDSLRGRGADGDYRCREMEAVLNRPPVLAHLYGSYLAHAQGRKGIVYAVSRAHAASVASYYASRGVPSVAIDSRTPSAQRAAHLEAFRRGTVQVLVNVDIFSEGFDCPDVEFIQLARPTLSLSKYLQMVGRGLRPHPGKACCVILDNVGLQRLFGLPTRCWDWQAFFEGRQRVEAPARVCGGRRALRGVSRPGVRAAEQGSGLLECLVRHDAPSAEGPSWASAVSGEGVRFLGMDFAELTVPGRGLLYYDLRSGRSYEKLPSAERAGWLELLLVNGHLRPRLRDGYNYGYLRYGVSSVQEYGFYCLVPMAGGTPPAPSLRRLSLDYGLLCLLRGEDACGYWLADVRTDGCIDVMDRSGAFYRVDASGGKRPLSREEMEARLQERGAEIGRSLGWSREAMERDPLRYEEAFAWELRRRFAAVRERLQSAAQTSCAAEGLKALEDAVPFRSGCKWGLRKGGRIVVAPLYRMIESPVGIYCVFQAGPDRWGVMRVDGRIVVEPRYSSVELRQNGSAELTLYKRIKKTVQL